MKRVVVATMVALALGACNRNDSGGPGEKAGKEVDRALDRAGKSIEQAGRNLQDASKGRK